MFSTSIAMGMHETPHEVWQALAKVFTPQTAGKSQWITLSRDGVNVNFFGPTVTPEPDPQDA